MAYAPLDSELQIRILRLRSRSFSASLLSAQLNEITPIHCDLYTVNREENGEYDALSYSWGDPQDTQPVLVKYTDKQTDYVEVDALCINQRDGEEKGAQVKKMRSVYASARRTRVWLGPTQAKSGHALTSFKEIGEAVIKCTAFDAMMQMNQHSSKLGDTAEEAEMQVEKLLRDKLKNAAIHQAESYDLLNELVYLLSQPYWTRVWILQEIVVSRKIDVFCGKSKIDFALLHAAVLYMKYMKLHVCYDLFRKLNAALDAASEAVEDDLQYDPDLMTKFNTMQEVHIPIAADLVFGMRQEYQSNDGKSGQPGGVDLIRLLSQIRTGRGATDPKDRIYALLGLAQDEEKLGITLNYDKSYLCSRVYCETARDIIASGGYDLLCFAQPKKGKDGVIVQPSTVEDGVPSWVPDWRNEIIEPCGLLPWHTPYNAAGSTDRGKFEKPPGFDSAPFKHLKLSGYKVDSIVSLRDQCNKGEFLKLEDREAALKYLQVVQTLCDESNKIGKEIYSHVSVRTMAPVVIPTAGMISAGFTRAASIGECVFGWKAVLKDHMEWAKGEKLSETSTELQYYYNAMARQVSRRPFITTKGFVGLAPSHTQVEDVVVIFRGAKFPYTLRKNGNGNYRLIGDTFLYGVMDVEFIKSDIEPEVFCLE